MTGPSEECVGLRSALIIVKVPNGLSRKPLLNWSLLAIQPTEHDCPGLNRAPPLVSLVTFCRWLRHCFFHCKMGMLMIIQ